METKTLQTKDNHKANKPLVWDCESSLYDSFELNSFKQHLDSAIASKTLSMPHLMSHRRTSLPRPCVPIPMSKASSKFSQSVFELLRSLFQAKPNLSTSTFRVQDQPRDEFYVFYEVGSLSVIPEVPETDLGADLSPEIGSLVRKMTSKRFAANSLGVSFNI